jgi:gluconolactonase
VYFTDPFYQRDYWKRGPKEQECEGVYYLDPGATQSDRVVNDLEQPNGLIGTPDGKILYVSDIRAGKTWKYTVAEGGGLTGKTLFCELGSDGMTIDDAGNVYLTGKGVTVFDPQGTPVQHIEVPEPWTANVCFGGADRQWLFITAGNGLYRIRTAVSGVGSQ